MDLATAGIISGAGQGLSQAAQTLQVGTFNAWLQTERNKFETDRLRLQNEFLTQRDTIAYNRDRADLAESRAYADTHEQQVYDKNRVRKGTEAIEDVDRERGMIGARARMEREKFDAGKDLRKDVAVEDITTEVTKATMLAENPAWVRAQKILKSTEESSASRAQAAKTMFELEQGQGAAKLRDSYLKLLGDPNADPAQVTKSREAWSAYSMKPGEEDRIDATNIGVGMREAGNEVVRLQAQINNVIPGTPEYAALQRRLDNAEASLEAYRSRHQELTGIQSKPKSKVAIKDRFKQDSGMGGQGTLSASTTTPAPELTRPAMPRGPVEPARFREIQQGILDYDVLMKTKELNRAKVHGNKERVRFLQGQLAALVAQLEEVAMIHRYQATKPSVQPQPQ